MQLKSTGNAELRDDKDWQTYQWKAKSRENNDHLCDFSLQTLEELVLNRVETSSNVTSVQFVFIKAQKGQKSL